MRRKFQKAYLFALISLALSVPAVTLPVFALNDSAARLQFGALNPSIIYGITTVFAFLLVTVCYFFKRKNNSLLLLHASVVIVNLGYFSLSISKTLEEALLANRIAYFGSVFLPLFMLLTLMDVCRVRPQKHLSFLLLCASIAVFILAASPGYLDLYYADVSLVFVDGMAKLDKVYGPLHFVYLVYLIIYFLSMIGVILLSVIQRRSHSQKQALVLLTIVFLNIAVWFTEQKIRFNFEFLSISYIVSEVVLFLLYIKLQESEPLPKTDFDISESIAITVLVTDNPEQVDTPFDSLEGDLSEEHIERGRSAALSDTRISQIMETWPAMFSLTARESDVLREILQNKKRKEIASILNVTEHTVKKHTRSIFLKLNVSSRADLFEKIELETTMN